MIQTLRADRVDGRAAVAEPVREPIWIALMLIQPLIWLLLYGQLFSRVPDAARRGGQLRRVPRPRDHLMNAFFGGSWSGWR